MIADWLDEWMDGLQTETHTELEPEGRCLSTSTVQSPHTVHISDMDQDVDEEV